MITLVETKKFVRNWKSVFVNFIEWITKTEKQKKYVIFPRLHKSCSFFNFNFLENFKGWKIFKIWSYAKVNACKMQKFCAGVDPQKFLYLEISTSEVGCKGSFFVVF